MRPLNTSELPAPCLLEGGTLWGVLAHTAQVGGLCWVAIFSQAFRLAYLLSQVLHHTRGWPGLGSGDGQELNLASETYADAAPRPRCACWSRWIRTSDLLRVSEMLSPELAPQRDRH